MLRVPLVLSLENTKSYITIASSPFLYYLLEAMTGLCAIIIEIELEKVIPDL